jgi:hypothetical protein
MAPKPGSCAEHVLTELCVNGGYCLPPERQERILADPPESADAFLDAVLAGELDRDAMHISYDVDKQTRKLLLAFITDWLFDDGQGRGTKSGLPRFPVASEPSAYP